MNTQDDGTAVSADLERLRKQAEQMTELETRILELEKMCAELLDTQLHLNGLLKEYRHTKEEWEWFFENSPDMLSVSRDGYFIRVNRAFAHISGYAKEELEGHSYTDFIHPDDTDIAVAELNSVNAGNDCIYFENRYRHKDGSWHWISWTSPAVTSQTEYIYSIARDITERKFNEAAMLLRAQRDPLTMLSNRAVFDQSLAQAIARAERNKANQVVLLLIDLDGFKAINDTHGHVAGDQVLQKLALRFSEIQRKSDVACRIGGDEFAWIIEGAAPVVMEAIAERIVNVTRQPIALDGVSVEIGCSIGISIYPDLAKDVTSLFEQADSAMYAVKKAGKNGYRCYGEGGIALETL